MTRPPVFKLGGSDASDREQAAALPYSAVSEAPAAGLSTPSAAPLWATDHEELSGRALAEDMETKGYQPVILFGNVFSGKTSVVLSLLSSIKIEPGLKSGLFLADPLLSQDTEYGKFQAENAEAFFYRKTQDFIEGTASPKTIITLPFFIPVNLRPEGKDQITFAFMESSGEWYRPDRTGDRLHPKLRAQVEDFLAHYQKGIIFIHLLPYTQQIVRSASADNTNDTQDVREAALAVEGAVRSYERVRVDKRADTHLMLVTKWDAYDAARGKNAVLEDVDASAVEAFVYDRYDKAVTALCGMGLDADQIKICEYCAGIINERGVVVLRRDNALRSVVMNYPRQLWTFLYRSALRKRGIVEIDPFPAPPARKWWEALMERLF